MIVLCIIKILIGYRNFRKTTRSMGPVINSINFYKKGYLASGEFIFLFDLFSCSFIKRRRSFGFDFVAILKLPLPTCVCRQNLTLISRSLFFTQYILYTVYRPSMGPIAGTVILWKVSHVI